MGERRGTFTLYIYSLLYLCLEKAMATHSSTLAWKIPGTEEPGSLQSMGLLRVGQTEWLHFHFSLSCIGEGNGNPLQCSCLENPRDWGAWWAAVYGVTQSRTRLKRLSSSSILLFTISIPSFYAFVFLRVHSQFCWSTGRKNHCREMVVSFHYFSSH